ncbi:MAG: ankyrin repeat domain-containing protein, partial [Acidobacteria bacterium]|nr:ankyrin repeat domain-containing protein [Acidobacteriota bacterium]
MQLACGRLVAMVVLFAWFAAPDRAAAAGDPPLVEAAKASDTAAVRALLDGGADVNAPSADGATALHWAAHRDALGTLEVLLAGGADVAAVNRYGVSPLTLACTNGSAPVIGRLLDAGADPNTALPGGETALMTVARSGSSEAVALLLARGADPTARETTRGQTALMWAAAQGHAAVIDLLADAGADVHDRSAAPASAATAAGSQAAVFRDYARRGRIDAFTPLLFAVRAGHVDAVRTLLERGAHVNDTAPNGASALVVAAVNAHWELGALLLDAGADPNHAGAGWTALHQVVRTRTLNIGQYPHPVPTGRLSSLEFARRLIAAGANLDARITKSIDDGYRGPRFSQIDATPYVLAGKGADHGMLRLLADAGADVTLTNEHGTTALMAAAGVGMFYVNDDSGTNEDALVAVQVALEHGADV